MTSGSGIVDALVARWAVAAARRPRVVLGILSCLALASIYSAATGLGVNTDTRHMLSPELAFQQWTRSIDAAFPMLEGGLVVVVRGQVQEDVDRAVQALADRFGENPDVLTEVFAPSVDPFLISRGLLFRTPEEIANSLGARRAIVPLVRSLAEDRSLATLFVALTNSLTAQHQQPVPGQWLDPILNEVADVLSAALDGTPRAMSWRRIAREQSGEAPPEGLLHGIVHVQPVLDFTGLRPAQAALDVINADIAALDPEIAGTVEIGVAGEPALRTEELTSVVAGIEVSLIISLVLVSGLLLLAFFSVTRALMALSALILALIVTSGLAGLVVGELNLVSVAFTVLLVGLGLDFAIHFLAHFDDCAGHSTVADAVAETCHGVGAPLALSGVTTALAFLSFVPTDFVGMGQLGLIGAMGVVTAFVIAVTLLPALLALAPSSALFARRSRSLRHDRRRTAPAGSIIAAVIVGAGTLMVLPIAKDVEFDTDPMELRDPDAPSMRVVNWLLEQPGTSPYRVSALANSSGAAAAIAARLEAHPEVQSTTWLGDLVASDQHRKLSIIQQAMKPGLDPAEFVGPPLPLVPGAHPSDLVQGSRLGPRPDTTTARDEQPADATTELLTALGNAEPGPGVNNLTGVLRRYQEGRTADLQARVTDEVFRYLDAFARGVQHPPAVDIYGVDDLPDALVARYVAADGRYRVDIAPSGDMRNTDDVERFVAALETPGLVFGGGAAEVVRSGKVVSRAMVTAGILALGLVGGLALLSLRSPLLVLAILVPLIVGAVLTAAASAWFDVPFNYANVIVLPLLIGLGVDSGIHLVMRGDRLQRGEAIFATSTPRAIVFSALTTIAAFGSLAINDHRGTASMGIMLTIALTCTVVSVLALTPPLVRLAKACRGSM